jgi:hypothetical protein
MSSYPIDKRRLEILYIFSWFRYASILRYPYYDKIVIGI